MVTRNIVKNTPTQVNSHLIGVRNLPDVIFASFIIYTKLVTTIRGDVYYINNKPYMLSGSYFLYEGERYYQVRYAVGVGEDPVEEYYYYKDTSDGSNPALYSKPEAGTQMYVKKGQYPDYTMEDAGVVCTGTANLTSQFFVATGPESGGYVPLVGGYQLNMTTGEIDFNGEILYAASFESRYGIVDGSFNRVEGIKYLYNVAESAPFPSMTVYTEGRPEVGSEAHTDDIYISQTSYVNDVTEGAISNHCIVSYSVDGNTWTQHPTTLTEDNNVIANIPRYMYLKFSQDVVITEE